LTLAVSAIVIDNPDWQYQLSGISVAVGQDTNLGTIELNYHGADDTEPTVLSHFPESNATDIPLNSSIIVTFSEDVIPASVQSAFFLSGTTAVDGKITYDPSTYRATFTPATTLDSDTQYTIEIAADVQDRAGHQMAGPYTSSFTIGQTDDTISPTAPVLLDATAVSDSQIDLSWQAASDNVGVTSYQLLRDGSIVKFVSTTWATDTNLSSSTNYCYTIIAVDAANNISDPSNQICEPTGSAPPPQTPSLIAPANGAELDNGCYDPSGNIEWDFDWNDVADATQYRIQVVRTGATDPFINTVVDSSSYEYRSNEYIPNTSRSGWTWKVRAGNDAGDWSQWSSEKSFTIEPVDVDCASGLVAYYPFNGNAKDESGKGNDGTVYGAISTTDRFGNPNSAYNFDGADDYVRIPDSTGLDITGDLTISAWINTFDIDIRGAATIFDNHNHVSPYAGYNLTIQPDGRVRFMSDGGNLYSNTPVNTGEWKHVAVTLLGTTATLFIDGKFESSGTVDVPSANTVDQVIGASFAPYYFFEGIIDDVAIYNRALSESEIQELYSEGG
jgi:chitodextrinase